MTHPSRVLNLDMKAKLCMPKSYIYIYSETFISSNFIAYFDYVGIVSFLT